MSRKMAKGKSRGFTLMELTIVLAVIGILISIASMLMAMWSSNYYLRGAAREVATDLQFTRLLAVKENKDFQVVFASSSYQTRRVNDGHVVKRRSLAIDYPGIVVSGLPITFNSRGNASSGTVTIAHLAGIKKITVSSTGRVRLE